jgi:NADPH:quinone reductase-like Zn-dependent oxidoreductase
MELSEAGEKYVLNLGNPNCESRLQKLAVDNHATIAFDAVAGDTSGMILGAMPAGSELIVYGGLSGKPVGLINPLDIIFKAKPFGDSTWVTGKPKSEKNISRKYLKNCRT